MQLNHYLFPIRLLFALIIIMSVNQRCSNNPKIPANAGLRPTEPENVLSTFQLEPGFKIELVASEPLISDPVDMEIDEYGRIYVVEMHGYPLDISGTGKIKLLIDNDGDGKMDSSIVFADGLILPNSIMRWKKGILVTDAPNVLYLEDTDNDGHADIRDTLLTGFALSNPQHNVSNPVYSLDNWIYLGHEGAITTHRYEQEFGDTGGEIYFPGIPNSPRLPKNGFGRTVRFRPNQHELETTSSATQFGHTFDAWGHHFEQLYFNHIYQEILGARYLERDSALLLSDATQPLSDHLDISEVFPIIRQSDPLKPTSVDMTSVCGITTYLGGAFPAVFDSCTFIADPSNHIIHVDRLANQGVSFTASRLHGNKEFLASIDEWFTPVNHYIGPDGALYVVDMYRKIIEHPEWLGDEVVKSGQLYNGSDRGRIYKITSTGAKSANWTKDLKLGGATNEQLVEKLASPNIWWRINAQRLLVDRANKNVVSSLEQMAKNSPSPMGRLHALWTLEGMAELTPDLIEQALLDREAGIRENGIRLAELHLSNAPALANALLSLQRDADPKVRFQLLCTLGFINTPQSFEARKKLLFQEINDKWFQIAALSAPYSQTVPLLKVILDNFREDVPAYTSLVKRLTTMVGTSEDIENIRMLIQKVTLAAPQKELGWQVPVLEGLSQGLERKKLPTGILNAEQTQLVKTFFEHSSHGVRKASLQMLNIIGINDDLQAKAAIAKAVLIAGDPGQSKDKREEAINFMALRNPAPYVSRLKQWISSKEEFSIQFAAMNTLSAIPNNTVSQYVIEHWNFLTPSMQEASISTFIKTPERITLLLDALDSGKITQVSESAFRSVRVEAWSNKTLRNRVEAMLAKTQEKAKQVTREYQLALRLKGDTVRGKVVFIQNCGMCHQFKGKIGAKFGPDLGTVHNWQPEAIMTNILQPNMSRSSGYEMWRIELINGDVMQGIISSESPAAITLSNFGMTDKTINRLDIKSIHVLYLSAMPTGLEKQISQQDMAHLLAFLRQGR